MAAKKDFDLDRWMEEFYSHPAFATEIKPDAQGEYSPAVQALQVCSFSSFTKCYSLKKMLVKELSYCKRLNSNVALQALKYADDDEPVVLNIWPLILQYVGAGQTDFISDCDEDEMMSTLLYEVFAEPAPWDQHSRSFRL